MMRPIFNLLFLLALCSCASSGSSTSPKLPNYKVELRLEDKSGAFEVKRESGFAANGKTYVSQYKVFPEGKQENKTLEQSIVMSTPGFLKGKVPVLRPYQSQYKVWFDGNLYQTETKIDIKTRSLLLSMKSPEKQWQGRKTVPFPGGNGVFCYFSQVVECTRYTGFIDKAISQKRGRLELTVIWDGYPYIQEQYLNLNSEPFVQAVMEYDGTTKEGDHRFSLSVSGSVIFYLFNENYEYAKIFWPAQGFSLYQN